MGDDADFEREPTGITGLDDVLNGGIPKGNLTLVSGPPGTGKSTFGSQFLIHGAENGQNGVYITVGEDRERIIRNLRAFGWDIDEYIGEQIEIVAPPLYNYDELVRDIKTHAKDMDADRLFLDSLTVLKSFFEDEFTIRKHILEIRKLFDSLEATTITTAERHNTADGSIGVEEYVVDGVIEMYYDENDDDFNRSLVVKKMRGTEHSMERFPVIIGKGGMQLDTD